MCSDNRQSPTEKLKSQKGASMAIALLYFLVCAMVGSVVLAAASADVSHVKMEKQNEGNYLAVISAAELLKAQLKECTGEWESDTYEQSEAADLDRKMELKQEMLNLIMSSENGMALKQELLHDFYQSYLNCLDHNKLVVSGERDRSEHSRLTFELEGDGMAPVTVALTVKPDHVVLNGHNTQQLYVAAEAELSVADEAFGQYQIRLTMGGLIHYTLNEEAITENDPVTGESRKVHRYTSQVIFSPEEPYLSGKRQTGGGSE